MASGGRLRRASRGKRLRRSERHLGAQGLGSGLSRIWTLRRQVAPWDRRAQIDGNSDSAIGSPDHPDTSGSATTVPRHIGAHNDDRDIAVAHAPRPKCVPNNPAPGVTSARVISRRRDGTRHRSAGVKSSMSCIPCPNAKRTAMPSVRPLHVPRVERRVDRLRASVRCLQCEGLGCPTTATARLGVDALAEPVTTPRSRLTPVWARSGSTIATPATQ
jgi:hypothetical protein